MNDTTAVMERCVRCLFPIDLPSVRVYENGIGPMHLHCSARSADEGNRADALATDLAQAKARLKAIEQLLQDELCDCSPRAADDVQLNPHSPATHDFSCPYRRKWNDAVSSIPEDLKKR